MKRLLNLKVASFVAMMLAFGWVSAQTAAPAVITPAPGQSYDDAKTNFVNSHPDAYAEMNVPGTTTVTQQLPWGDAANKESWIAEHPREFAEFVAGQTPADNHIYMTRAEFNAFPAEKQRSIMSDSKFIIID